MYRMVWKTETCVLLLCLVGTVFSWTGLSSPCLPCDCRIVPQSMILKKLRVKIANCSSTGLTEIPRNLPHDVEEIYFNGNNLRQAMGISYSNFWKYNETKVLHMQNANLKEIPVDLFRNTTKLQVLDLSGNQLDRLAENVFQSTPLLTEIYGLEVRKVQRKLFGGLDKLRHLDLTTGEQLVSPETFENLPLKSLRFVLKSAMTLPSELFKSSNDTLHEITIEGKSLTEIPADLFSYLDLRKVVLITPNVYRLPATLFQGASELVSHINEIQITGVKYLPENLFHSLLNLITLRLHGIRSLPPSLFDGLIRLDVLDMSNNSLSRLDERWFRDVGGGLKELTLSRNGLSQLGEDGLAQLESLEILDLSYNSISALHPGALRSLHQSLTTLDLSHNWICALDSDVFNLQTQLKILRLDDNCLTSITQELFADMFDLKELHLQHNNLERVAAGVFGPLGRLEVVNMSSCHLAVLPANAFSYMPFLRVLDLSNNSLEHLPIELLASDPALEIADLGENPLHCDCGVLYFTILHRIRGDTEVTGTCREPRKLQGKAVGQLPFLETCSSPAVLEKQVILNPGLRAELDAEGGMPAVPPLEAAPGVVGGAEHGGRELETLSLGGAGPAVAGGPREYVYSSSHPLRSSASASSRYVYYSTAALTTEIRASPDPPGDLLYYFTTSAPLTTSHPTNAIDVLVYRSPVPLTIVNDPTGKTAFSPAPPPRHAGVPPPRVEDVVGAVLTPGRGNLLPHSPGTHEADPTPTVTVLLLTLMCLLLLGTATGVGAVLYHRRRHRGSYTVNSPGWCT